MHGMRLPDLQKPFIKALFLGFILAGLFCFTWATRGQGMETRAGADAVAFIGKSNGRASDYDRALAVVTSVLKKEFELPVSQTKFLLYPNREVFEANLVHIVRFDPVYAREVAGWAVAVGAPEMVLANEEALERIPWSERIRVLAHELVHTVQYGLAGGRRGTSDQWLREGFADWIAYRVLESLDTGNPSFRRALLLARIKGTVRRLSCAPLSEMVTLQDFTKSRTRVGGSAIYSQCFLAVDLLVKQHGVQAALDYFSLFKRSDDRLENFRTVFSQDLAGFERDFNNYLRDVSQ
jgi:hypothetical protein